jgi:hypothetical protein
MCVTIKKSKKGLRPSRHRLLLDSGKIDNSAKLEKRACREPFRTRREYIKPQWRSRCLISGWTADRAATCRPCNTLVRFADDRGLALLPGFSSHLSVRLSANARVATRAAKRDLIDSFGNTLLSCLIQFVPRCIDEIHRFGNTSFITNISHFVILPFRVVLSDLAPVPMEELASPIQLRFIGPRVTDLISSFSYIRQCYIRVSSRAF